MDWKEAFSRLQESPLFAGHTKDCYLVHVFSMFGQAWQFGYYHPETDKVIVFTVADAVSVEPPQEAAKEGRTILQLHIENVTVSPDRALAILEKRRQAEFPADLPDKTILLLQRLDRPVWNITLITLTFAILNAKIDAETGEVLSLKKETLLRW
ncbi:MAG: PepSY domain-containing protein [archaeon]